MPGDPLHTGLWSFFVGEFSPRCQCELISGGVDWRQFSLPVGLGSVAAGVAMWNAGLNPALHPATSAAIQGAGAFLATAGIAVVISIAISIWRRKRRLDAKMRVRAEAVTELLGQFQAGMALMRRKIESDDELKAWQGDVLAWRESLGAAVTKVRGRGTAVSLDQVSSVSAADFEGAYNDNHNAWLLHHNERLRRLQALTSTLEDEDMRA